MNGLDPRRAAIGPPEAESGGCLTIDLTALAANWRNLAARAAPAETAAVVKADAYGIGIEAAVLVLARAGCQTFFVAHLSEAKRARQAAPDAAIYVLNGFFAGSGPAYAEYGLRPVLGSVPEIADWAAFVQSTGIVGHAALHVDTGMNRLGLRPPEAIQILMQYPGGFGFTVSLLMSHLVAAEDTMSPLNERQISTFEQVRRMFAGVPASLANSSGIFLGSRAHFDMVRPGYALYGGNPNPGRANLMKQVVTLEGRIVQVRLVSDRETVGYGATWMARVPSRIATVSVGYADGYPRSLGAGDRETGGTVLVHGRRCPVVGRVSMDLIAVDITELPEDVGQRGDMVTLIGEGLGIDDVAERAGTIGYEVLTRLGRRYRRIYVGA
jgi:alanine racemase